MQTSSISDPLFRQAVEAIDRGEIELLEQLITAEPRLIRERLINNEKGYFKDPFLLWFVADNPIRNGHLSAMIVPITRLLVHAVAREAPDTYQYQLDYALGLVASGRIPKESGVQIEMMDVLLDAGATPGKGEAAYAHGNLDAGAHLLERGGELSLTAAVCLDRMSDAERLALQATETEKEVALTAAAFYARLPMLQFLTGMGINPNIYPDATTGFHTHATPLHQAVYSGSLEAVKLLVDAGAILQLKDRIYDGTPLDWAEHLKSEESLGQEARHRFAVIAAYLQAIQN